MSTKKTAEKKAVQTSLDDILGPAPKKAKAAKKPKAEKLDDILGPPPKKAKKAKAAKKAPAPKKAKAAKKASPKKKYEHLKVPKNPDPKGLFHLRDRAGKTVGAKCLICKTELKYKRGRPPVICKKDDCYRSYKNHYRRDYKAQRAKAA